MTIPTKLFAFTLLLLFIAACSISNLERGIFIPSENQPVSIEFETVSDLIIIKAEINGLSGRFLFDNGFSLSAVSKDFANKANINFSGASSVQDANNKKTSLAETTVETVKFNGQLFKNTGFYQVDTKKFFPCHTIDGVIGASIINKANWLIDFSNSNILISSRAFQSNSDFLNLTKSNNNSSFVKLTIEDQVYNCKIDLGNSGSLELKQSVTNNSLKGKLCETRNGIATLSATGLGNIDTRHYLIEKEDVTHHNILLTQEGYVSIRKTLKYDAYLGLNYLNEYDTVILNLPDNKMALIGNNQNKPLKEEFSFGLSIYKVDSTWHIIQKNAADTLLSSLNIMDELTFIDSLPVDSFKTICDYKIYIRNKKKDTNSAIKITTRNYSFSIPLHKESLSVVPEF